MGLTQKQRGMKAAKAAARAATAAAQIANADPADPHENGVDLLLQQQWEERAETIACAADLAHYLGETAFGPRLQLLRIVRLLGPALARELLAEALRIECDGGELVADGVRYRSTGGIFFRLVRELVTEAEWATVTGQVTTTATPMPVTQ